VNWRVLVDVIPLFAGVSRDPIRSVWDWPGLAI
jgi:hypothetical protein